MLSAIFTHYGSVKQSVCVCSRDHGGKNVICKKWNLIALSGIFEHFFLGISEKKVSGNLFRLRGAVGRKSKKKKKNFHTQLIFRAFFLFVVLKRMEKVNSFRFCDQRRGKIRNKNFKKKKSIFPLQGAFSLIFVGNLPEKIIRKFFGGKEKN